MSDETPVWYITDYSTGLGRAVATARLGTHKTGSDTWRDLTLSAGHPEGNPA
ncbi:hypothetical protein SAMN05444920_109160 [Nonomuraea solani]|uniref:Uncharacterized protein n=1 Tax=Nonomuraea solani TaxID=1144553 RepID=A0A1H6EDC1_9ACTN|nr:hypothetical protein [Nonomuraea solani]SEG95800.1 hypothetical protein SAMN05444920_109160 [Nonomuraea solani]